MKNGRRKPYNVIGLRRLKCAIGGAITWLAPNGRSVPIITYGGPYVGNAI